MTVDANAQYSARKPRPLPRPGLQETVILENHDDGEDIVRWRSPGPNRTWIWFCLTCVTKTNAVECEHTLAAAVHLAQDLLGVTATTIAPPPKGNPA